MTVLFSLLRAAGVVSPYMPLLHLGNPYMPLLHLGNPSLLCKNHLPRMGTEKHRPGLRTVLSFTLVFLIPS